MSSTQTLFLHGFWRSSAAFRVRVALRLKNLPFEEISVNLETGEQRGAAYLALNPQGTLPTLIVPGLPPLTQSLAILEFLDEYAPAPALLPGGRFERAWVRSLAALLTADTHPLITPRVRAYARQNLAADDEAWRAWQTHWFHAGLLAFEQRLANAGLSGDFCLGDEVGMADICLASIFAVMEVLKIAPPADLPIGTRILANASRLAAFADSAPYAQAGAPAR